MMNSDGMRESLEGDINLVFGDKVVLLGSCFSDNLAPKFEDLGFETVSNPFGTIFHPLALAEIIQSSFETHPKERLVNREDLWFDWRGSSTLYGMSPDAVQDLVDSAFASLKAALLGSKLLVVTFGTAWGYHLNSGEIVANCHKIPQENFQKKMTDLPTLFQTWKDVLELLQSKCPELKVVFTVSPVDHIKDGLVGNSRSKARLIELTARLEEIGADYFYSYEWVKRHFSDAKFYESDEIHLNAQAIELFWQICQRYFFEAEAMGTITEVRQVNQMRNHRSIHPESKAAQDLKSTIAEKMKALSQKHPEIYWR